MLLPRNFSNRAYRIFVPRSTGKRVVAFRSVADGGWMTMPDRENIQTLVKTFYEYIV